MLIAICGIDGSGKTTQVNLLKNYLEANYGKQVFVTKQPTDFYRNYGRFRNYVDRAGELENCNLLYELALLSATDKLKHYGEELLPNRDKIIVSDRYVFSAFAYFIARGILDIEWLKDINKFLPFPDITIYLDIDPQIAFKRIVSRDGKYTKKEETDITLLSKVRKNFIEQPWGNTKNYYIILSEKKTIMEVHNMIVETIKEHLEKI